MTVHTRTDLAACLREAQEKRAGRVILSIARPLADEIDRPRLMAMTDLMLPLCQGHTQVIRRERNGEWYLNLRLYYRAGLRMADAWKRNERQLLSPQEREGLSRAEEMASRLCREHSSPSDRARAIAAQLRNCAVYDNPPLGSWRRGEAINCLSVLLHGRANCQGFSDAFYLLCTLAGLEADYRLGCKAGEMHLWNALRLEGRWLHADATAGCTGLDDEQCRALGLRWEDEEYARPESLNIPGQS